MKHRFSIVPICMLASLVLAACSHTAPPPVRIASLPPQKPIDRTIGTATMLADGTIVMELNTSMDTGPGHMTQRIKPGDMQYAQVLKKLGGLKPGQSKRFADYPVD